MYARSTGLNVPLSKMPPFLLTNIQSGQKPDTQFYFLDNFSNSTPTLTILSLLQAEIYGA